MSSISALVRAISSARAHEHGVGASFQSALGGGSDVPGDTQFHGRFRVEALSDGRFPFTGEMYAGGVAELGPTAALRVLDRDSDVRIVVGSRRCQCLGRAIFSHLGIAPHEQRILAVKSTVHFRADFEPISETILLAEAPGLNPCRLESIPYRRLRGGVRLGAVRRRGGGDLPSGRPPAQRLSVRSDDRNGVVSPRRLRCRVCHRRYLTDRAGPPVRCFRFVLAIIYFLMYPCFLFSLRKPLRKASQRRTDSGSSITWRSASPRHPRKTAC